ncbi:MAG: alpha-1,4-glucan--maltose-1-phosphate maltosyltransferase [Actinomycetota bacterium]
MIGRIPVLNVRPQVAGGRWPARAVVGETLAIGATVFREGHDQIAAGVVLRAPDGVKRPLVPMVEVNHGLALWEAAVTVDAPGLWSYVVEAWGDPIATWRHDTEIKHHAGVPILLELEEGALVLERAKKTASKADRPRIAAAIEGLRDHSSDPGARLAAATQPDLVELLSRKPVRDLLTASEPYEVWVDREKALFSAWYELFPRSICARDGHGGTFRDAAMELPRIAAMGFDVVYLPPIHPIGLTYRKGPNNTLKPGPSDPGSPWAIGGAAGGHEAIEPGLGTFADFDAFVLRAKNLGLEVALDFALNCSPDHPWVTQHPEWFSTRADGTIAYAENPPKKYQDIYPLNFDNDPEGLSAECLRILRLWMSHGVRIFRVDNPHTKPVAFWEWLIFEVKRTDPDVLFLAEAFTRPPMMKTLAQIGFTQSYTYFTWRTGKADLQEYCEELAHTEVADYMRPNFWPNTPDILHAYLQYGGPPAFSIRATLAALLTPSWGIYSGYELCEATAIRPGSEEYLDSEKFQYRPRDFGGALLTPHLTLLNRLRREHPALRWMRNLRFHVVDNDDIMAFSKSLGDDRVLVVVNLDPHHVHEGTLYLDTAALGLNPGARFAAYDEVTGATYTWDGSRQYIRLDPYFQPAHIFTIREL